MVKISKLKSTKCGKIIKPKTKSQNRILVEKHQSHCSFYNNKRILKWVVITCNSTFPFKINIKLTKKNYLFNWNKNPLVTRHLANTHKVINSTLKPQSVGKSWRLNSQASICRRWNKKIHQQSNCVVTATNVNSQSAVATLNQQISN